MIIDWPMTMLTCIVYCATVLPIIILSWATLRLARALIWEARSTALAVRALVRELSEGRIDDTQSEDQEERAEAAGP